MQIIHTKEHQHPLNKVLLPNNLLPIERKNNIRGEDQGEDEVGGDELVVLLLGDHAELHVHGVPDHHEPQAEQDVVVVPVDFVPIGVLGDNAEGCGYDDHVEEVGEGSFKVVFEDSAGVEGEGKHLD